MKVETFLVVLIFPIMACWMSLVIAFGRQIVARPEVSITEAITKALILSTNHTTEEEDG